ncbi:MAG TPA: trypsin-like peptidase domain-containing protein [Thermoanaerobaculia bacterium]|nr:trypsin-like peptidase domain-containing protein [Thermoanaerobaculia bacterium]
MSWTRSLLAILLLSVPAAAETVPPLILPELAESAVASPPPLRLAESQAVQAGATLRRAAEGALDRMDSMTLRNLSGALPVQNGFARPLPSPVRMRLAAAASSTNARVWGSRVRVAGAWRLRLHLEKVSLPAGTRLWVWGAGEEPRPFGLELLGPDGDLWTPSVGGEDLFLEIALPAGGTGETARLEIREVGELFRPGSLIPVFEPLGECIQDASCTGTATFDAIAAARKAVAHLEFEDGGDFFICSGGLLNDAQSSGTPYLLTANHCFSNQASASSLEAFWDFRTSSCNGADPNLNSLPRSNGATLLATGESSDFTFVRLSSIPSGRAFLGWTTNALAAGTVLHRLSHPAPDFDAFPQSYSRTTVSTSTGTCSGSPRPRYLYALPVQGGTFGGSSGSPVMIQGGIVVGQLTGGCGDDPEDGCAAGNSEIDGAFSSTFPSIAQFLGTVQAGPCTPNATTLCVDDQPGDRRFKVQVTFQGTSNGNAIPLSSLGVNSGGLFWFFDPSNPELLVKVLNGCGLNNKYWIFWSAGTDVALTLTVTDTVRGQSKTYTNPQGTAAKPVQDTSALPCS